jgi:hypothetical protein
MMYRTNRFLILAVSALLLAVVVSFALVQVDQASVDPAVPTQGPLNFIVDNLCTPGLDNVNI